MCFVVYLMARIRWLARLLSPRTRQNSLNKEQTDGNIGPKVGICETGKANLAVYRPHSARNDLVLKLSGEAFEGEFAADLVHCSGKYPGNGCQWRGAKHLIEQCCWFPTPENQQQEGHDPCYYRC